MASATPAPSAPPWGRPEGTAWDVGLPTGGKSTGEIAIDAPAAATDVGEIARRMAAIDLRFNLGEATPALTWSAPRWGSSRRRSLPRPAEAGPGPGLRDRRAAGALPQPGSDWRDCLNAIEAALETRAPFLQDVVPAVLSRVKHLHRK